jgi:hypothetical protein
LLFAKGITLQEANKLDEACKMFESSLHLDPQVGARLNVAACRERKGLVVEAHAQFMQAAEDADRTGDRRASFARQRAEAMASRVVRVRLRVADSETAGLSVTLDACTLSKETFSHVRVVSPGPILVRASAPERKTYFAELEGAAGSELTIDVPVLAVDSDAEAERKAREAEALAAIQRRVAEEIATERERDKLYDRHPARTWTIVGAGVGTAGVVAGEIFGVFLLISGVNNSTYTLSPTIFSRSTV